MFDLQATFTFKLLGASNSMSSVGFDPSQLTDAQQEALGTYTAVTNQEASAAVPLLRRSEWNVQVRHTRMLNAQNLT